MNGHPPGLPVQGGAAHSHRSSLPGIPAAHGQEPKPMPSRPPGIHGDRQRSMGGMSAGGGGGGGGPFNFSRSPPSGKNTSHVPCKFYKLGNCQAGAACPFSHAAEHSMDVQPCKYFAKGNCKFGQKCALLHILSDGRVVNRPGSFAAQFNGSNGHPMSAYGEQMQQQQQQQYPVAGPGAQSPQHGYLQPALDEAYYMALQHRHLEGPAGMDGVGSFPGHSYASSPQDGHFNRSPTIFAQPMPDLDPRSTSYYAKFGPVASSVPSKFGLGPLTSTSPTTSTVTSTAFGNLDTLARREPRMDAHPLGSSPPSVGYETAAPRHLMPQERRRSKPQMISASVGASPAVAKSLDSDPVDDGADYGEAFLPNSLSDLLTPQEKMRRFSRADDEGNASARQAFGGLGSPNDSKFGSLPNASPSSRFGALFARKRGDELNSNADGGSGFGHVGSPLRNSSLHADASPSIKPISRPLSRDHSPFGLSSPPTATGARSSALSQQLSTLRLGSAPLDSSSPSTGGASGVRSGVAPGPSALSTRRDGLDRAVSNSSASRNERISEENEAEPDEICVFEMDEEQLKQAKRKNRLSGGSGVGAASNGVSAEGSGKSSPVSGKNGAGPAKPDVDGD